MITIGYITSRLEPRFEWLFDSLKRCGGVEHVTQIILVDQYAEAFDNWTQNDVEKRRRYTMRDAIKAGLSHLITWRPPKPNVWNGRHRLTPRNWWGAANARNTALCLCKNDFIAYLDDRCVLGTTWIDAIREAKEKRYAVCGTYEKHTNMVVEDGIVVSPGETIGRDGRADIALGRKMICPGTWMYGCTFALPVEWMLRVNGVDESWDSVSMEDTHFGQMLENNGYPIYHDPRMSMIEDRTTNEHGMKRSSKELHPNDKNDKTHKLMERLWNNKCAGHAWNLGKIRDDVLSGLPFPVPTEPVQDWFDGEALAEMW